MGSLDSPQSKLSFDESCTDHEVNRTPDAVLMIVCMMYQVNMTPDAAAQFQCPEKGEYSSLPPANEVCERYVFTSVCQSFCSRGGGGVVCLSACWDTPPSLGRHPPPRAVHAGRYGQQAGGKHPTGMHTCFCSIDTCKNDRVKCKKYKITLNLTL